jgi:hypothetical protein
MAIYYYPPTAAAATAAVTRAARHGTRVRVSYIHHGACMCRACRAPRRWLVLLTLRASAPARIARVVCLGTQVCRPCHALWRSCVGRGRAPHARVCRPWSRAARSDVSATLRGSALGCVGRVMRRGARVSAVVTRRTLGYVGRVVCCARRSGVLAVSAVSCGVRAHVCRLCRTPWRPHPVLWLSTSAVKKNERR